LEPSKKIVIIGPAHPYRGGIASFIERLGRQFGEEGHEVDICTFTLQYPNFLFPGKSQFSEEPAPKDLRISRKINAVSPVNWIKVGKEIRNMNTDLVIFNYWLPLMGPCFGKIARQIDKNKKTKLIAVLHNVIPHEKRPGDSKFTKYFLKPMDGFITMARSVEKDLDSFNTGKPKDFNPHPLYDNYGEAIEKVEAKKALDLDPQKNYILFFGIVRDYKGLDLLLEAFSKMDYKSRNLQLLVAGEYYTDEEKYRRQIKELQIEENVTVVNHFIKDSDVGKYFCAADIVAQPYKSATQSGVTQIAYHYEIPMLVTNVGGLPEMVPNGKVGYVTSKNTDDIANALTDFFTSNKEEEFKANLKVEKQKYLWDKLTAKILKLAN
jgi:D-inositol-3-phosphate glycosyltransferase